MRPAFLYFCALLVSVVFATSCSDTDEQTTSTSSSTSGAEGSPCVTDADCTMGFNLICAVTDDGQCGPTTKKCIQYPPSCGEGTYRTVCGCDGKPHAKGPCPSPNPSFQIDMRDGACPPVAGMISCGDGVCSSATQYCIEGHMSVECADLPPACMGAQANCACMEMAGMAACGCANDVSGGVRVNGCGI